MPRQFGVTSRLVAARFRRAVPRYWLPLEYAAPIPTRSGFRARFAIRPRRAGSARACDPHPRRDSSALRLERWPAILRAIALQNRVRALAMNAARCARAAATKAGMDSDALAQAELHRASPPPTDDRIAGRTLQASP